MVPPMSDSNGRKTNGLGDDLALALREPAAPPDAVAELADACVRFVERKLGVRLDYSLETLPVLDHYLLEARAEVRDRPELAPLLVHAAGAYFGEVVRRRVASWWHMPSSDPASWQIQAEPVYLWFEPVGMAYDALLGGDRDEEGMMAKLEIEDEDRETLELRLSELPPVDEDEFYALSTRLEVIDIATDVIKARMVESGLGEVVFTAQDYES